MKTKTRKNCWAGKEFELWHNESTDFKVRGCKIALGATQWVLTLALLTAQHFARTGYRLSLKDDVSDTKIYFKYKVYGLHIFGVCMAFGQLFFASSKEGV